MQRILCFRTQLLLSKGHLLHSSNLHFSPERSDFSASIHPFSPQFSCQIHIKKPIVCLRNAGRRNGPQLSTTRKSTRRSGSQLSTKFLLKSILVVASNLRMLPEPLNLVVSELCSGNGDGGGLGFRKGFGGGGGGSDGWRRKKKLRLEIFGLVLVCGFAVLLGAELGSEYFWVVLGFYLFGVSFGGWKTGFKDWVLGFSCCAVLMGLGLTNQEVRKQIERSGVYSSIMNVARRRRRRRKI